MFNDQSEPVEIEIDLHNVLDVRMPPPRVWLVVGAAVAIGFTSTVAVLVGIARLVVWAFS